jgi:hypothetical protein
MEPRINNGTKHVFDGIEIEDSRNIVDVLDDGLQLQPASN